MPLSQAQKEVANDAHRFRVLVSGRRFGKTHLSIRELSKAASKPNKTCWYVAPSYRQAKQIVWLKLKEKLRNLNWVKRINESDLSIQLINGSVISLKGADNSDSLRGVGLDFLVMDEFADIDEKAWTEVLRPTLSDTGGSVLFTGTPKGISNWAYDLYKKEREDKSWRSWQYTTIDGGQVPLEEIEQARQDLDERTFRQEYEAKFETYSGIIYYNFNVNRNILKDDDAESSIIYVGMDFNIDPMSAVVAIRNSAGLFCIDDISIYGSNTDEMVQEIKNRYKGKKIIVFPDPASKQRKTSAGGKTDLSILMNAGFEIKMRHQHPAIRDRINSVNSALHSTSGDIRLRFHPRCKNIIKTLERQIYKPGTSVPENNGLEHMADALGYMVEFLYPVTRTSINTSVSQTWGMKVK
jgi:PBSX family phage terminase large subunit